MIPLYAVVDKASLNFQFPGFYWPQFHDLIDSTPYTHLKPSCYELQPSGPTLL